jgi:ribosomal protein S18 acetylase RimI-like enzyme
VSADTWTLAPAGSDEFDEIMAWFPDGRSLDLWGGPAFRYPFTRESFLEDLRIDAADSYGLRDADNRLGAFGQCYERYGRGHLARLVTNPALRRQGVGRRLIEMIIATLEVQRDFDEYSLFVYRHNEAAVRCYRSLGFAVTDYPEDAPMPDKCYFLTRKARRRN